MRLAVATILALTAAAAFAQPVDPTPGAFVLRKSYEFGNPQMPAIGSTGLLALCRVATSGTSWECVNGQTGASFGTVTQGTGSTYQDTPFGVKAMSDVTSAKAPKVVSTSLDSLFKGDHTLVMGGYSTTLTDATYSHWFGATDGTNTIYVRREGGALHCAWSGAGGTRTAFDGTSDTLNGWTVATCRRSANNHYSRTNGSDSVVAAGASISGNFTAGTEFFFGERQTAGHGFPLRGPFAWAAIYSAALTDAQLDVIERRWWGVDVRAAAAIANGVYCLDPDAGSIDCYKQGAAVVGPAGLRTFRTLTAPNRWAADNLAAGSWTDVATPTVTSNASSGPFSRWRGGTAECDLIADNDGAAFEGKMGATGYQATTGSQAYTASCYLAAGTSGTTTTAARLTIDVTGGGWVDAGVTHSCDVTGLTSTVTRQTCTSPPFVVDAGSPTVRGSILVGNTAAQTGSITTCQCQLTPAAWAAAPVFDNASLATSTQTLDPSADAWPATSRGGKYEVIFTPTYNPLTQWRIADDITYLFDAHDSDPNHVLVMLFGYQAPGVALASVEAGDGLTWTRLTKNDVALTSGQSYAVSTEWLRTGATKCSIKWRLNACSGAASACRARTLIGSATVGVCPTPPTAVVLGNRNAGAFPTDVSIAAVRVYGVVTQ